MRAFLLALVIGVTSLGGLALTPSHADAHEWQSGDDTIAVRWHGGHYHHGWYGGSHYYTPYYGGGYYYPSYYYNPGYNYYYSPGYSNYYSPGYSNYYVPAYRYYRPGLNFYLGL